MMILTRWRSHSEAYCTCSDHTYTFTRFLSHFHTFPFTLSLSHVSFHTFTLLNFHFHMLTRWRSQSEADCTCSDPLSLHCPLPNHIPLEPKVSFVISRQSGTYWGNIWWRNGVKLPREGCARQTGWICRESPGRGFTSKNGGCRGDGKILEILCYTGKMGPHGPKCTLVLAHAKDQVVLVWTEWERSLLKILFSPLRIECRLMLIDADWAMVVSQESDNREWHQIIQRTCRSEPKFRRRRKNVPWMC